MFYKLLKGKYSPILSHFDEYTQFCIVSLQQSHNRKKGAPELVFRYTLLFLKPYYS
ncbi:unknown [Prevotella sp. CAG:604]|nr:unknown [Prevotella sp. CAG:604]